MNVVTFSGNRSVTSQGRDGEVSRQESLLPD